MMKVTFQGIECQSEDDALGWIDARGWGRIIRLSGTLYVLDREEADRLASLGIRFTYLFEQQRVDGSTQILTVPVNDD